MEQTGWAHCPSCAPVCVKQGEGAETGGCKGGSHVSGATCMKGGVSVWGSQKWWGQLTFGTPCLCEKDGEHRWGGCMQMGGVNEGGSE